MRKYLFYAIINIVFLFTCSIAIANDIKYGNITGVVDAGDEESAEKWLVMFYDADAGPAPITTEYWRALDYSKRTSENGSFTAQLPEGKYYVVALKKSSASSGNPHMGDLIYPPGNIRERMQYIVKAGETTDIGVITGAVPFKEEWFAQGKTGVEGFVLDDNGKPLEGLRIRVYTKPKKKIPHYIADRPSDANGKFTIRVPEGGEYYLKMWDKKNPWGYAIPDAVTVKTGEMTKGVKVYPLQWD